MDPRDEPGAGRRSEGGFGEEAGGPQGSADRHHGRKSALILSVAQAASAKINLTLRITGKRADGYHLLDSLVAFARIGDTLELHPADRYSLTIDGPFAEGLSNGPDNLVTRAIESLAEALGRRPAVSARLTKRLPIASGIGGGSADAAAALRALLSLWSITPEPDALASLALSLGADAPVCLDNAPRRMQGIGEQLTPIARLPLVPIVLVNPGVPTPTGAVFKARTAAFSAPLDPPPAGFDAASLAAFVAKGGNDLAPPARRLVPVIDAVLAGLNDQPGCRVAAMSGSGATCFGLFETAAAAKAAASAIGAAQPGWWAVASHLTR